MTYYLNCPFSWPGCVTRDSWFFSISHLNPNNSNLRVWLGHSVVQTCCKMRRNTIWKMTDTHTHRWCITALPLVDIQKNNCLSWSEPIVVVKLLCLCQIPVSDVCVSTLSETEPNVSTALVKVLSVVPDSCRETNKDVTKRQKVSQRCIDKGEGSNNNAPYRAFWTSTGEENSSIIKNRNYYKAANIRRDIIKKGLLCVQSYGCFFTLWWEVRVN